MGVLKGVNYDDPAVKYRGEKIAVMARKIEPAANIDPDTAVDIYYTFFLPFPVLRRDAQGRSAGIVSAMISSPRLLDVKNYTVADSVASSVAAAAFIKKLAEEGGLMYGGVGGEPSEPRAQSIGGDTLEGLVEEALREAAEKARATRRVEGLLQGLAAGTGSYLSLDDVAEDVYRLAENTSLAELLEFMRGFEAFEAASHVMRRREHRYSRGEVRGYELGGDIERLVPEELALPQLLFYSKLAESRLLLYEKVLRETPGPLYVLLDKCIPEDTPVAMAGGGEKELGEIEVGDIVLAAEPRGHGLVLGRARVVGVKTRRARVWEVRTRDGVLEATENHVVPVYRSGVFMEIPVGGLRVGDELIRVSDSRVSRSIVLDVRRAGVRNVRDIVLDSLHHYVAGGFLVHNSGSMVGNKMLWAKAVALSLARRALGERRFFIIRFFDSIPYPSIRMKPRIRGRDLVRLLDYVARVKASGGTDITRAIMAAIDELEGLGRSPSDIVLVTDGEDKVGVELVARELRRINSRLYSVMIQGENPDLRRLSEEYLKAVYLDSSEALRIVRMGGKGS